LRKPGRQARVAEPDPARPRKDIHLARPDVSHVHDDWLSRTGHPRRPAGVRPRRSASGRGGGEGASYGGGRQTRPGEACRTVQNGPARRLLALLALR